MPTIARWFGGIRFWMSLAVFGIVAPRVFGQSASISVSASSVGYGSTISVSESVSAASGDVLFNNFAYCVNPSGSTVILWDTYTDYYWQNSRSATGSITLNQAGTWTFYAYGYTGDSPNTGQLYISGPATVYVSAPPLPSITSALDVYFQQGQTISYSITASASPTGFSASGLPAGLSLNTGTGMVSGRITGSGTVNSSINASNANGSDTRTLIWHITATSISATPSISPAAQAVGVSVSLTSSGSTNFGLAWVENVIWPASGPGISLGNTSGFGTMSFTPTSAMGSGTYWYQIRVVDVNSNYVDGWQSFFVGNAPTASISRAPLSPLFGQTVAYTAQGAHVDSALTQLTVEFCLPGGSNFNNWASWTFGPTANYSQTISGSPAIVGNWILRAISFESHNINSGWQTITMTVGKATPSATFNSRTLAPASNGYYTVVGADLNASFTNPYTSSVTVPTASAVSYVRAGYVMAAGAPLSAGGSYSVQANFAGDANYNSASATSTFTVGGPTSPPAFTASLVGSNFVSFGWSASSVASPATLVGYNIYRNGAKLNAIPITSLTYTDTTPGFTTPYDYAIQAVDSAGYQSVGVLQSVTTSASFEIFTP